MKKKMKGKLSLSKFQIAKLNNPRTILGGNDTDDVTKTITKTKLTEKCPTIPTSPTKPEQ
ncbi:hypothetical protein [Aquimarina latercula]|uniref:hypothetical protein n=1 Tax=Aquimarina latercula TaxID=987 RepID=UPI000487722F|nr:hypothetical protein [Aquimarina latercula]